MAINSLSSFFGFLAFGLLVGGCEPVGISKSSVRQSPSRHSGGVTPVEGGGSSRSSPTSSHGGGRTRSSQEPEGIAPQEAQDGGTYESIPIDDRTKAKLDIAGFERGLAKLSEHSGGQCAEGTRKSLENLFDNHIGGQGHADQWSVTSLNNFAEKKGLHYSEVPPNTAAFQDFDVRMMQPNKAVQGSVHGHVEIFYKGRWYSDFKETQSQWDANRTRYRDMTIFRLGDGSGIAMYLRRGFENFAALLLPSAWAEEKKSKPAESSLDLIATTQDKAGTTWKVAAPKNTDAMTYMLYRNKPQHEVVASDSEGFFLLLNKAPGAAPVAALGDDFMRRWVVRDGKASVQKQILEITGLIEVQRDAYVRNGFELPKKYSLIIPKKN
ncbi:MAG: hypothetical protein ABIR96_01905 [Bdellovibrionota bacterium]